MLPRDVVYLDPDSNPHPHVVRYRWDGALDVVPGGSENSSEFVLVLDPGLPFRRRFRMPAAGRFARHGLSDLASELFPFSRDASHYALGEVEREPYVFALPDGQLRELSGRFSRAPQAVLVGRGQPRDLRHALSLWVGQGRAFDFLNRPRPIPRSLLLSLLLAGALLGAAVWASGDLMQTFANYRDTKNARIAKLKSEAELLARRRVSIAHMNAAYAAVNGLFESGGGRMHTLLESLVNGLPDDIELRSVVFDGESLKVSGWSKSGVGWTEDIAGEVTVVEHDKLPERDRFEIEIRETAG